jgi:hypothetical protein
MYFPIGPSLDCQLMQLLAPYDDPLERQEQQHYPTFTNVTTQNDRDTAMWIAQQLQQQPTHQQALHVNKSQQQQQHLIGSMPSVNTQYMDGLSMRFNDSNSPKGRQASHQTDCYDGNVAVVLARTSQ